MQIYMKISKQVWSGNGFKVFLELSDIGYKANVLYVIKFSEQNTGVDG